MRDDNKIFDYILKEYGTSFLYNYIFNGDIEGEFSGMEAGTEYAVLLFGYEAGVLTTKITRQNITTLKAGSIDACKYDIVISDIEDREASVTITPSDYSVWYYWNVFEADATEEDILAYIEQSYNRDYYADYWEFSYYEICQGKVESRLLVVKNSYLAKVAKEKGWSDEVNSMLSGPTAVVIGKGEPTAVAKAIMAFVKDSAGKATVKGAIGEYAGLKQIDKTGVVVEKTGTDAEWNPTPEEFTAEDFTAYAENVAAKYVKMAGKLTISDSGKGYNYYNFNMTGSSAKGSFSYVPESLVEGIERVDLDDVISHYASESTELLFILTDLAAVCSLCLGNLLDQHLHLKS